MASFWVLNTNDLRVFDKNFNLQNEFQNSEELIAALETEFTPLVDKNSIKTAIVIQKLGCRCNRYQEDHLQQLVSKFPEHSIQLQSFQNLTPKQAKLIPSVTAVVIINKKGWLEYFGPLNSGIECNSHSSFVESLLEVGIRSKEQALLNLQGQSCAC